MPEIKPVKTENINVDTNSDAFASFRKDTAMLRLIADVNPASIMLFTPVRDEQGNIQDLEFLYLNRQAIESMERGDLTGKYFAQQFPFTKTTGLFDHYVNVIETGIAWSDDTYYFDNGIECWAKVNCQKLGDGCLVSYLDITEQKKATNELLHIKEALAQNATDKYYQLFNSIEQGFCILEVIFNDQVEPVDYRYIATNPAFEKHSGLSDVCGKTLLEVVPDIESSVLAAYRSVAVTGEPIAFVEYVKQLRIWFDVYAFCIDAPSDRHIAVLFRDITKRKETEEALLKAEEKYRHHLEHEVNERTNEIKKLNSQLQQMNRELEARNTELKTFNSIAANDYNETLRHLYTSMEYIISNDARQLSDAGRANIRRAQASIQKMKLLTEDIVSYTKLHEIVKKKETVDLDNIIENVLSDYEKKMDVSAITVNCSDMPEITGYPFLVSLLLHHLIDNSIKFRRESVSLVIDISCKEWVDGSEIVNEEAQPQFVYHVLSVKDNGIGFPPQHAKRLFEIFYRVSDKSKYRGSGIGLAVCKKIMQMHYGFITGESEPGTGSTFHCYFPVKENINRLED